MLSHFLIIAAVANFTAGQAQPGSGSADPFDVRLDYLRRQNLAVVGRDAKVAGYQKLIEEHAADPRVADAMLDVAHLMENEDPETGLRPDPASALRWFGVID